MKFDLRPGENDAHPEQRAAAAEASRLWGVQESRGPRPRGEHCLLDRRQRRDLLGAAFSHDAPLVFDGQGGAELALHFWCAGRSP